MNLPPLDCAGCRKCCIGDVITIRPDLGDDPARWKTDESNGTHTLKRDGEGNCVYLTKSGCSIHGSQPAMCRSYDCRVHLLGVLRVHGVPGVKQRGDMPALAEGLRRLRELKAKPQPPFMNPR